MGIYDTDRETIREFVKKNPGLTLTGSRITDYILMRKGVHDRVALKNLKAPSYYDTPADVNILQKFAKLSAHLSLYGGIFALYDIRQVRPVEGFVGVGGRLIYWLSPTVQTAGCFVLTNAFLTKYRGKDDYLNHFASGVMSIVPWAFKFRMPNLVFFVGGLCGLTTGWTKDYVDKGYYKGFMTLTEERHYEGSPPLEILAPLNFSVVKDIPPEERTRKV